MTKKQKVMLVSIFAAVLILAGAAAGILNYRAVHEGKKTFEVEVISERDSHYAISEWESDLEYLGEFLRAYDNCEWQDSEYGIYITGFDGFREDMDNQYWWCITVNGESVSTGADEIPLKDGDKYTFTLMQGWKE